jgi:hypothetical protein
MPSEDRETETGPKECILCGETSDAAACEACAEAGRIFEQALAWARANAEELSRASGGEPDLWYAIGAYFDLRPAEEAFIEAHLKRLRSRSSRSVPELA